MSAGRLPLAAGVGVVAAILAAAPPAPAQRIEYAGSLQLASGDYIFTERTNSLLLFNGLSVSGGCFRVSVSVPLIYQSTPFISYGSGLLIPSGGPESADVGERMGGGRMGRGSMMEEIDLADTATFEELGLGDVSAHAEIELLGFSASRPSIRLTAGAKVPVAGVDRGFGTGEWDYGAGLSAAQPLGRMLILADFSYWILGDMPDLELKNPVSYALAVGHPLSERLGLLVSVFGYSKIIEGTDPPAQLSLGLSYLIGANRSLTSSAAFGLTESSPDVSVSVGWRLGV
jgi:hypothetical protein